MSKARTNVGFHGISKIEIREITTHKSGDIEWQAVSMWLYDRNGKLFDSVTFYSDTGPLTIDVKHLEVAAS